MSSIEAMDEMITKLRSRSEPLSVELCVRLADWLEDYVRVHDEKLLSDAFLTIKKEKK